MNRQHVSSSCIRSIGYDPARRWLDVEYTGKTVYRYFEVPEAAYLQVLNAASIGREWNALKDAFQCIQLEE